MQLLRALTVLLATAASGATTPDADLEQRERHPIAAAKTTKATTAATRHLRTSKDRSLQANCIPGRYYYTYGLGSHRRIGSLDVSSSNNVNEELSTPSEDCPWLRYLAFDGSGTAYGQCWDYGGGDKLVRVDLTSGETTEVVQFPSVHTIEDGTILQSFYEGLAYNPVDDHFYTTATEGLSYTLVKIEKDWTFTRFESGALGGPSLSGMDLAIDSAGNAFATNLLGEFYYVDLSAGTSTQLGDSPTPLIFRRTGNIAFSTADDTLYGIAYSYPAPLFAIEPSGRRSSDPAVADVIQDTEANGSRGGAFCPMSG